MMAQYFEVLKDSEGNSDQSQTQFFTAIPDDCTQVRYVLADEGASQFQTQQVMVLDNTQQPIIINHNQGFQQSSQQQSFSTVIQGNMNNSPQQIFFMETSSPRNPEVQTEQMATDQNVQAAAQQQLPLTHQVTTNGQNIVAGQIVQAGSIPRSVLQVRTPISQTQLQVNQQRQHLLSLRQVLSQQRPQQSPVRLPVRAPLPQQLTLRAPTTTAQIRQQLQQPNSTAMSNNTPPSKNQFPALNRPVTPQQPQQQTSLPGQVAKALSQYQQRQQQQQQQQQQIKNTQEKEIEDHDSAMNSTPGLMNYTKLIEQRQQIGKSPILARLPANIKPVQNSQIAASQQQLQGHSVAPGRTIEQQNLCPQPTLNAQTTQRKAKVPSRARPAVNSGVKLPGAALPKIPQSQPEQSAQYAQHTPPQSRFISRPQQAKSSPPMQTVQQPTAARNSQVNYIIRPPSANRAREQRPLPAYIASNAIQQIIENSSESEDVSDSIRMLVLLENGEQRLITFTLPKEACTIMEILEQVNVPFTKDTNIQVIEANTNGINYIVTVGNVASFGSTTEEEQQPPQQQPPNPGLNVQQQQTACGPSPLAAPVVPPRPPSPELPKLIAGKLAVCNYCGYTGEDFNKCRRCNRKLPEKVRAIDSNVDVAKPVAGGKTPVASVAPKADLVAKSAMVVKKKIVKPKATVDESVVISSDDEEEEKKPAKTVSEQILTKLGASISISPVSKEPSLMEIKRHVRKEFTEPDKNIRVDLNCRTVRVGSCRLVPAEDVILDCKCVVIKAPLANNKSSDVKTVRIDKGDIVKVLVCFNKVLPVVFYYVNAAAAPMIQEILNLSKESGWYFDPIDEKEDSYRKITLLPEDFTEEQKIMLQNIYGDVPNIIEELTVKEANDILIKTCPKDASTSALSILMVEINDFKAMIAIFKFFAPVFDGSVNVKSLTLVFIATIKILTNGSAVQLNGSLDNKYMRPSRVLCEKRKGATQK